MLVLNRKVNQRLVLGDHIELLVLRIKGNRVTLGLRAPHGVSIHRGEVQRRIEAEVRHDLPRSDRAASADRVAAREVAVDPTDRP